MSFLLASTSTIKKDALVKYLKTSVKTPVVFTYSVDDCGNPEQPVGIGGLVACKRRIQWILENKQDFLRKNEIVAVYSIENAIKRTIVSKDQDLDQCFDVAHVMFYKMSTGIYEYNSGNGIQFENKYWDKTYEKSKDKNDYGWSLTVGEVIAQEFGFNPKNWVKEYKDMLDHKDTLDQTSQNGDRVDQIYAALRALRALRAFDDYVTITDDEDMIDQYSRELVANIDYVFDHPKKGILFQDMSPIQANKLLFENFIEACFKSVQTEFGEIDYIIGLQSRGYIPGAVLAYKLGCGFVCLCKKGKLPGPTIDIEYEKEYGSDWFEIKANVIKPNSRVLFIDDLLATGGSLECGVKLVRKLNINIEIAGCFVPLSVKSLEPVARKKLDGIKVVVLAKYTFFEKK